MEIKDKIKILLNPVGGLYYNDDPKVRQWVYQRPVFNNIYIDSLTIDIAIPLADVLKTVGTKVYSTRLLSKISKSGDRKFSNSGESQQPRYRECAVQYLKSIATYENQKEKKYIPPEVYTEGNGILEQDFNARINYAKFIEADIMITIDATTYISDGGLEVICNKCVGSEILANYIIDEVAKRTRAVVKGVSYADEPEDMKFNALTCPSIILKCGSTTDVRTAQMLIQGYYRQWISLGCFSGIWKYLSK